MEERADVMRQLIVALHERAVSSSDALEVAQELIVALQERVAKAEQEVVSLNDRHLKDVRLINKLVAVNQEQEEKLKILEYISLVDIENARMDMEGRRGDER
jgi:hypothetical protein